MGVSVKYRIHNASIPCIYWTAALVAINKLFEDGRFSWLDAGKRSHVDLVEALKEWGFEVTRQLDQVVITYFEWNKLGDEDQLLATIAPYLNPNTVVECFDRDQGFHWRYVIKNKQLIREEGRVVYEDKIHLEGLTD